MNEGLTSPFSSFVTVFSNSKELRLEFPTLFNHLYSSGAHQLADAECIERATVKGFLVQGSLLNCAYKDFFLLLVQGCELSCNCDDNGSRKI